MMKAPRSRDARFRTPRKDTNSLAPVSPPELEYHALDPSRWSDLEKLFGDRGACGGCWCMYWRLSKAEFDAGKGDRNRERMRQLETPGLLGYAGGEPVAWCAVAPRAEYVRLEASRILRPVDDEPVWSITCLFVRKDWRRRGVSERMIAAAAEWARSRGAQIVEAYPVEPVGVQADPFVWTGLASAYEKAGFAEVARRSPKRPIMRWLATAGPAFEKS